ARNNGLLLRVAIKGKPINSLDYSIDVKSARVKSALIFASLFTESAVHFIERSSTLYHTYNILSSFGAQITTNDLTVKVNPNPVLQAQHITIPGDISSAAFFLVAAALVPGSKITLLNVGLNPTRTGILDVLSDMGANVEITNFITKNNEKSGDITLTYKSL